MLNIIDNANLPSRINPNFNPWLETILEHVKGLSQEDFVLRLSAERKPSAILYHLENSQNKTMACISKKGNTIRVETFRRELPDPERFIKPSHVPVEANLFECTAQGIAKAAQALCSVVGTHTPYSQQRVLKAKVYDTPQADDPWALHGGIITGVTYVGHDEMRVTVNHHTSHLFKISQFYGHVIPRLTKHLVMDNRGHAEVINESEFDFYFERHHAHDTAQAA